MPTYTIDMSGQQDGWANAASALAKALTPNYEAEIAGRVAASQVEQNFAGADANYALARERNAAAGLSERELATWGQLDAMFANEGMTPEEREDIFVSEYLPRLGKVDGSNAGDWGLALGGMRGASPARMTDLMSGAGAAYSSTPLGFGVDQDRQFTQFNIGEENDLRQVQLDNDAEMARKQWETFNAPVSVAENATTFFSPKDPRYVPGGATGQRSVSVNEMIIGLDGNQIKGPQFVPEAPKAPTTREVKRGTQVVTEEWTPAGWVEVGVGPRTSDAGELVQSPVDKVFEADMTATLQTALANGAVAQESIGDIDWTIAALKSGVPTGFWIDKTQDVRSALASVGLVDPAKTALIEKVTSDLGERVMARIAETKGAVSNAEMDYFRLISASIGKTPAGNLMLLDAERRAMDRAVRMRNFALSLQEQNLTGPQITAELERFKAANPLFSPAELADIKGLVPDPERGFDVVPAADAPNDVDDLSDIDLGAYD